MTFGALAVVFGDIGTSPLYTLQECLLTAGGRNATREVSVAHQEGILQLLLQQRQRTTRAQRSRFSAIPNINPVSLTIAEERRDSLGGTETLESATGKRPASRDTDKDEKIQALIGVTKAIRNGVPSKQSVAIDGGKAATAFVPANYSSSFRALGCGKEDKHGTNLTPFGEKLALAFNEALQSSPGARAALKEFVPTLVNRRLVRRSIKL